MKPTSFKVLACSMITGVFVLIAAGEADAQEVVRGRLHVIWDTGEEARPVQLHLVLDDERSVRLDPDMAQSDELVLRNLDRRQVEIRGGPGVGAARRVQAGAFAEVSSGLDLLAPGDDTSRRYDFVTVLCRFADDPVPPFPRSHVERSHGGVYPGVRHFYAELSWNPDVMSRSRVTDWYVLPHPRSHYVTTSQTDFGALARDCTQTAERDVYFPNYYGINLQFSSGLARRPVPPYDTLSYGGSWTLTLNGLTRIWGVTWLSAGHASNYAVLAHEIGHALGWPHSSGAYGAEYDSDWDIMSRGYLRYEQPYGWIGIHTISGHKDAAGWIPPSRRWLPEWETTETRIIARTAQPSAKGALFARVPISANSWYTVESRRVAGYDRPLPAEAVVLHRVSYGRAYVVDVDGNGNPNDHGAQWLPGEEFQDSAAGFSMRVDAESDGGFEVTITRGWRLTASADGPGMVRFGGQSCDSTCSTVVTWRGTELTVEAKPAEGARFSHWEGDCAGPHSCTVRLHGNRYVKAVFVSPTLTLDAVLNHLLGSSGELSDAEVRYLDLQGNRNGRLDIGDVRRWIENTNAVTPTDRARARALLRGGG